MGALKQNMIRQGYTDSQEEIDDSEYFEIEAAGQELAEQLSNELGRPVEVGYYEAKAHYLSKKIEKQVDDLHDQWEANESIDIPNNGDYGYE